MRIIIYLRALYLEGGGIARLALDLCDYLARAGHDTTLATWDTRDVPPAWRNPAAGRPRLMRIQPAGPLGVLNLALHAQLRGMVERCDVVHVHVPWDPSVARIAAIARRLGKPYILSPNGMLDDWCLRLNRAKKRLFLAVAGRRLIDRAACIHCAGGGELDEVRAFGTPAPLEAIPLIFDLDPFRSLPGPDAARARFEIPGDDLPAILFLARLHPIKRPEALIRAAAMLRDRGQRFRLLLAGPGDPPYVQTLRDLVRELSMDDRVRFLGMVGGDVKASLLQAAAVTAQPSSHENFGITYFESLACGTPVLATRGAHTWRELDSSGGALIVDDSDPAALDASIADALAEALSDRARLGDMGRRGREWVLQNLEPSAIIARYVAMYQRAIDRTP